MKLAEEIFGIGDLRRATDAMPEIEQDRAAGPENAIVQQQSTAPSQLAAAPR